MNSKIKIALVDDELFFKQGISVLLNTTKNFEVIFTACNESDLKQQLRAHTNLPQIIITNLNTPQYNANEVTTYIKKHFPKIKIIALTSYFNASVATNMIKLGAVAYLAKNSAPDLMIKTIKEVALKGFYYDDLVIEHIHKGLISTNFRNPKTRFGINYFTKRESEILQLICNQLTTKEIANKLFISPRTVEGHRNNLLQKTASKNVAGLVIYAIKNKLFSTEMHHVVN